MQIFRPLGQRSRSRSSKGQKQMFDHNFSSNGDRDMKSDLYVILTKVHRLSWRVFWVFESVALWAISFVCLFVFLFVCSFVCQQLYAKTNGRISMKFSGKMENGSWTNPLNFGVTRSKVKVKVTVLVIFEFWP